MSLRELCHCGHDRLSHAEVGPGVPRGDCLALGCDCKAYVNEFDPAPKPAKKARRYGHPATCRCFDCKQLDPEPTENERTTDPWDLSFTGP